MNLVAGATLDDLGGQLGLEVDLDRSVHVALLVDVGDHAFEAGRGLGFRPSARLVADQQRSPYGP